MVSYTLCHLFNFLCDLCVLRRLSQNNFFFRIYRHCSYTLSSTIGARITLSSFSNLFCALPSTLRRCSTFYRFSESFLLTHSVHFDLCAIVFHSYGSPLLLSSLTHNRNKCTESIVECMALPVFSLSAFHSCTVMVVSIIATNWRCHRPFVFAYKLLKYPEQNKKKFYSINNHVKSTQNQWH